MTMRYTLLGPIVYNTLYEWNLLGEEIKNQHPFPGLTNIGPKKKSTYNISDIEGVDTSLSCV